MKNNAVYRYDWNVEHNNMSLDCEDELAAMTFALEAAENELPEEEKTQRLAESIREHLETLTPEKARAFLSQLPMYTENGQLKDEY